MNNKDLRIALVQQDIIWENKQANFDKLEKTFNQINQPIDLVILPETFNTGFSPNAPTLAEFNNGPTLLWVKQWAEKLSTTIIGSWYAKQNDLIYNRLFCVSRNNSWQYYDKRHTFRLSTEAQDVEQGNSILTVCLDNWRIRPFVCYDLRFPTWVRNSYNADDQTFGYDLAIFVANWPATRAKAWQRLLQARSIENLCYTIGVNRVGSDANNTPHSGNSMVISPNGNIIHQIESGLEELKIISLNHNNLDRYRTKYPFHLDWDEFNIM